MSVAGRVACLVALCLGALAASPAIAACGKSIQEIENSPEWARLYRQHEQARDRSDPNTVESISARAVRYGYLLGRQARYIGNSAERDGMFTCLREGILTVMLASDVKSDPARTDRLFQSALLGTLDDADFERHGIDTKKRYPSIFEADWTGLWGVTFIGPTLPGQTKPLKTNVSFSFRQKGDGSWLVRVGSEGDMRGPYAARADGGVISFELPKTEAVYFKFALSQDDDASCRGKMTTTNAKTGRATNWHGTGERQ
ncbi:MAG: hypothetical protein QF893_00925 [Alphaproteobacteria bacterium]|jgi:hypothetical protein|nr:hypothetical protein [Alphaproteobacteria bacterium]